MFSSVVKHNFRNSLPLDNTGIDGPLPNRTIINDMDRYRSHYPPTLRSSGPVITFQIISSKTYLLLML